MGELTPDCPHRLVKRKNCSFFGLANGTAGNSDRAAGNATGRVSGRMSRVYQRVLESISLHREPRAPRLHARAFSAPKQFGRAGRGARGSSSDGPRARGGRARFSVEGETLACVRGTHARVPDPNGQRVRVRIFGILRPRRSMTINRATTLDKVIRTSGTILSDCRRAVVG